MLNQGNNIYKILGIMSGSSLDGIDLAFCEFNFDGDSWNFKLIKCETVQYNNYWIDKLTGAPVLSNEKLEHLHRTYGLFLGNISNTFLSNHNLSADFIASHGHTVFHAPEKGFTFQLGHGKAIATESKLPVICDFRSKDIALGGQGAPLVPVGDSFLFGEYDYCLNIGGIANISYKNENRRIAYDICPSNQILNHLSRQMGMPFDRSGKLAQSGQVNNKLLAKLNKDEFYQKTYPKSLSNQYVLKHFIEIIDDFDDTIENKLRTAVEHISEQLSLVLDKNGSTTMLVTGGGAHNEFLISKLKQNLSVEVILPEKKIIDFKEALIFAFLGLLRYRNEINCLASVTGAKSDSSCGVIYHP
jgi:anhydro-N-acetylmuramic acid kinase